MRRSIGIIACGILIAVICALFAIILIKPHRPEQLRITPMLDEPALREIIKKAQSRRKKNPYDFNAGFKQAQAQSMLKDFSGALATLDTLVKTQASIINAKRAIDYNPAKTHIESARMLMELNQPEDAFAEAAAAYECDFRNGESIIQQINDRVFYANSPQSEFYRGRLQAEIGNPAEALSILIRIPYKMDELPEMRYYLGLFNKELGNEDLAEREFNAHRSLYRQDYRALKELLRIHEKRGDDRSVLKLQNLILYAQPHQVAADSFEPTSGVLIAGNDLIFTASGKTGAEFTIPGTVRTLIFSAKIQKSPGQIGLLRISVDDSEIGRRIITQNNWREFKIPVMLERGAHKISIMCINNDTDTVKEHFFELFIRELSFLER